MAKAAQILIVEDEYITAKSLSTSLESLGYQIAGIALSFAEAVELLETKTVDLALLDINLEEEKSGIDLARLIHQDYHIPYIYLSAYSDPNTLNNALGTEPYGYLVKPYQEVELFTTIEITLEKYNRLTQLHQEQTYSFTNEKKVSLFIKHQDVFNRVYLSEIRFVESQKNYLRLVLDKEEFKHRSTIKEFLTIESNEPFLKTHRAFVVNKNFITGLDSSNNLLLLGSHKVPIARNYKEAVLQSLL